MSNTEHLTNRIYRLWKAGLCPCCGSALVPNTHYRTGEITEPAAIGEGVMMCGRCIENEHHLNPPEFTSLLLEALVRQDDSLVEPR